MFYPEILSTGKVSETWHGTKALHEAGYDRLSPMVIHGCQHFYVNELALCKDGEYAIPLRWVSLDGVLHGECIAVDEQEVRNILAVSCPFPTRKIIAKALVGWTFSYGFH